MHWSMHTRRLCFLVAHSRLAACERLPNGTMAAPVCERLHNGTMAAPVRERLHNGTMAAPVCERLPNGTMAAPVRERLPNGTMAAPVRERLPNGTMAAPVCASKSAPGRACTAATALKDVCCAFAACRASGGRASSG